MPWQCHVRVENQKYQAPRISLAGCFFVFGLVIVCWSTLAPAQSTISGSLGEMLSADTTPVSDEYLNIRLEDGDSLRSIAQKYLSNPDLWPIILDINNLQDISQFSAGRDIKLPANQVKASALALDASLDEIQKANEAGAQLFAPLLIKTAIKFRDDAIEESQQGAYGQSISLSSKSISTAGNAKKQSEKRRDVVGEARLNDRQGWVEGQKVDEVSWSERVLNSILNEEEKIRTLSKSTAQVIFRDSSRLRLNPNSQAIIQRMRVDPLNRSEEAKISLVEGNFYALLATESQRSSLEVNLPNVDATIESGSFFVSQDEGGAKFSNYDAKPVAITAGDETIVLGRNEGAYVRNGEVPNEVVDVLARINLTQPKDNAILYGEQVQLGWTSISGGREYWLEIAFDQRFDKMADSRFGIKDTGIDGVDVAPGIYYWRVAALDQFGLPGQMSTVRRFEVRKDDIPPFLRIRTPSPNQIFRDSQVTISGETEAGAAIHVNGEVADIDIKGRFFYTIKAEQGLNKIDVVSQDVAGNKTHREMQFTYLVDKASKIEFANTLPRDADGRFLTAGDTVTLSGVLTPDANIRIIDPAGEARAETYSNADGSFVLNLPLLAAQEEFTIIVTSTSGYAYEEALSAAILDTPPNIRLKEPLAPFTSQAELKLALVPQTNVAYVVNGILAKNIADLAIANVPLMPGPNLIEIIASNAVGLVSIDKRTIIYDGDAPEINTSDVNVEKSLATERITMSFGAVDQSGMAKTSRYTISYEGFSKTGVLRYSRSRKSYQGRVEIPLRPEAIPLSIEIEIADIAGNVRRLELTR
ncbi:MAG: FecR domain-containing protein [Rhizobiales bacterium]|nr:FecR domain-containing protein [Hyphomicrobiales bacterium]